MFIKIIEHFNKNLFIIQIFQLNLQRIPSQRLVWVLGWEAVNNRKRYKALFLDSLKPGKLQIYVKSETAVDANVDMYRIALMLREQHKCYCTYLREVSAVVYSS